MNSPHTFYTSPLVGRNASAAMSTLFGAQHRIETCGSRGVVLAEAQGELGLDSVTEAQLEAMRAH